MMVKLEAGWSRGGFQLLSPGLIEEITTVSSERVVAAGQPSHTLTWPLGNVVQRTEESNIS